MRRLIPIFVVLTLSVPRLGADPLRIVGKKNQFEITLGGKRVATYVYKEGTVPRPYFQNVRTVGGVQVTRNHPPKKGEPNDHPHHTGIFLGFGDLNGLDYWHAKGKVVLDRIYATQANGDRVGFVGHFKYLAKDGKSVVCTEEVTHTIQKVSQGYLIRYECVFVAKADVVKFGSKEEGGVAVRVASPLAVDAKKGGRLLDSEGRRGGSKIWGQKAKWVDYSGPLDGKFVGVMVMPHPEISCWWHARDYGLFAGNPFGPLNKGKGETLKKDQAFRLAYGVLIHEHDDESKFDPKAAYETYSKILAGDRGPKK